jgi:hypothetical protein
MTRECSRHKLAALFFCTLALISPALLAAQETARWDVFGGFSAMRFDSTQIGFPDYSYLYGWNAEVTGNIFRRLGVTLDGSGNYGSQMSLYHYMIGPQYTWRRETHRFFARGLFGKEENMLSIPVPPKTSLESVGRSFGGGGGFDWDFNQRITIRVFQADYLNTHTFGKGENNFRVSAGVVFHFGHIGHRPRL